jgi:hypothetical protein
MMTEEQFIDACGSAQVVWTPAGHSLLIGGFVVDVKGPDIHPAYSFDIAAALAKAMRAPVDEDEPDIRTLEQRRTGMVFPSDDA